MKYSVNYLKNRFSQGEFIIIYTDHFSSRLFYGILEGINRKGKRLGFTKFERNGGNLKIRIDYLLIEKIRLIVSAEKPEGRHKQEIKALEDLYKELPSLLTSPRIPTRTLAKRCRVLRKIFQGEDYEKEKAALTNTLKKYDNLFFKRV